MAAKPFYLYPITQGYGPTTTKLDSGYKGYANFNKGIDFGTPLGTPANAVVGGTVEAAGDSGDGWGISVKIRDKNGFLHNYGHLSNATVRRGQTISAGSLIGLTGNTGKSTGPHLSYDLLSPDGEYVNPMSYQVGPEALGRRTPMAGPEDNKPSPTLGGFGPGPKPPTPTDADVFSWQVLAQQLGYLRKADMPGPLVDRINQLLSVGVPVAEIIRQLKGSPISRGETAPPLITESTTSAEGGPADGLEGLNTVGLTFEELIGIRSLEEDYSEDVVSINRETGIVTTTKDGLTNTHSLSSFHDPRNKAAVDYGPSGDQLRAQALLNPDLIDLSAQGLPGRAILRGTDSIIDMRQPGQFKPIEGLDNVYFDAVSNTLLDREGNTIRREELAVQRQGEKRLQTGQDFEHKVKFPEEVRQANQTTKGQYDIAGDQSRVAAISQALRSSVDLQGLFDNRGYTAARLAADPGNFVEREYISRALAAPEQGQVPLFRDVPTVGSGISSLMGFQPTQFSPYPGAPQPALSPASAVMVGTPPAAPAPAAQPSPIDWRREYDRLVSTGNYPGIPQLAAGGTTDSNVAWVGEAGEPELLIDHPDGSIEVIPLSKIMGMASGGMVGQPGSGAGRAEYTGPGSFNPDMYTDDEWSHILATGQEPYNPNSPNAIQAASNPPISQIAGGGPTTHVNTDAAIQGMPSLRYLQGKLTTPSYNTLSTENVQGAFGTQIPEAGGINISKIFEIMKDPVAMKMLESLYRSASRSLSAEVERARARAPLGQAAISSLVRT